MAVTVVHDLIAVLMDMLVDWPIGTILGAMLIVMLGITLGFVCYGLFWLVDHPWRPMARAKAEILRKDYAPAHTQWIPMPVGKATMMMPRRVDESFSLCLGTPEGRGWASVTGDFWRAHTVGEFVGVTYSTGRISGSVRIRGVYV